MKIIIFAFLVLIKHFIFKISILGILVLAHRKKFVQANIGPRKVQFMQHDLNKCKGLRKTLLSLTQ